MNIAIAQKRVDDLAASMLAKGMVAPRVSLFLKSHEDPLVLMEWADKSATHGTSYATESGETPGEAFDKAVAFIAARPSAEENRRNEFRRALGRVIDLGREYNIETDFINPLSETMKRLSENALTDQRAVQPAE